MKKAVWSVGVALCATVFSLTCAAELRISEICAKPSGSYSQRLDPNGYESGWIELYNAGSEAVNLSGYTLDRFNRGKAAKAGTYAALPDITVAAGGYQIVYTSEDYPASVNDGKTPFVTNGCVVVPFKINAKKYPYVRLLKGSEVVDTFIIPVELDDGKTIAAAGAPFANYTGESATPAIVQPPEAVQIAVDESAITRDDAKGITAVAATASLAATNIWSLDFTFTLPTSTTIPSTKTGLPLFNAPGAITAYLDCDGQIELTVGANKFEVDYDGYWNDGKPHTLTLVCGPFADSRFAVAVDGTNYIDRTTGVATPLDATKSLLFGQISDTGDWTAFNGNISDVKLYTGSKVALDASGEVVSTARIAAPSAVTRVILPTPTKGTANNMTGAIAYGPNAGPLYGLKHSLSDWQAFTVATNGQPYEVSLMVNPLSTNANDQIVNVTLVYRAFDPTNPTTNTLAMALASTDAKAAGNTYKATIPAEKIPAAGNLLQWCAIVTDAAGNSWRTPRCASEVNGYEWYATIVQPTSDQVSAKLPTWHIFADQDTLDNMDKQKDNIKSTHPNGVFCGIYDSQTGYYYDHVLIDLRGNTTAGLTKKSHSLKFLKCQPLSCTNPFDGEEIECRKTSMLAEYADPSRLRSCLSFYLRRQAGQDVPFCYPIRTQLNGKFYQLCFHTNRFKDELFEDYFDGDYAQGHAFKNCGDCDGAYCGGGVEQQLPDSDDYPSYKSEFDTFRKQFISYVKKNHPTQSGMTVDDMKIVDKAVVRTFDLPGWLNFLALSRLTQECDDGWSTLCLYYDAANTKTWTPFAYDVHQSFGAYYRGDNYGVSGPWADNDYAKCHPYYGGMRVVSGNYSNNISRANRAYECIYQSPKFRRLMARRLRTLMDDLLKAPGTAQADTPFWKDYAAKLVDAMQADDVLDRAKWGLGTGGQLYVWSGTLSFAQGVQDLWDNYIVKRRKHFFTTHAASNTSFSGNGYGGEYNAMLPGKQSDLATLKAGFSIVNQTEGGTFADTEKVVIKNANAETVDMSGWKITGVLNITLPAGTVVDANDTITITSDRAAYVAANDADLTDQVIVGNATVNAEASALQLTTADDTVVAECVEPTDESQYLRLHSFYGNTNDGEEGDTGEWICLTNISGSAALSLTNVVVNFLKAGDSSSKCNFTIAKDLTIAPNDSIVLEQADYKSAGWKKITNNKLVITITDRNGGTCQSGTVTQSNHPKADGKGAYLILNTTAKSFTDADFTESSILWITASATPSKSEPNATIAATIDDLGEGNESVDLLLAYAVSGEELGAGETIAEAQTKGSSVTKALTNLEPNTTYDYAVTATNATTGASFAVKGSFKTTAKPGDPSKLGNFTYKAKYTLAGYQGGAPLTNFPVLVRISADSPKGFDYANCAADGSDLRFGDKDFNQLDHEIENWDPTGESLVWVRVPVLTNGVEFTVLFGGTPRLPVNASDVWPTYAAVWHMSEENGTAKDSTANGLDAEPKGAKASTDSYGDAAAGSPCGIARHNASAAGYTGANSCYLLVPNYDSLALGSTFTASGWVKFTAPNTCVRVFCRKTTYNEAGGWHIETGRNLLNQLGVFGSGGTTFTANTPSFGDWAYLTFVYNGTTCSVYANGALYKSGTIDAATDNGKALGLGSNDTGSEWSIPGWMDEFRLRDEVNSEDWIKAEYDTMKKSSFVTAGTVEELDKSKISVVNFAVVARSDTATASAYVTSIGEGATSAEVTFAYGTDLEHLGEFEKVTDVTENGTTVTQRLAGLTPETDYVAILKVVNNAPAVKTLALTNSFTTTEPRAKLPKPSFGSYASAIVFTTSGYTGDAALTDYPVLIRLADNSPEGFHYADVQEKKGGEIRFADASGNMLAHEIETWNTAGESLIWVKVPSVTAETMITMYYGGTATVENDPTAAWSGYAGVWHMDEDEGVVADATGHGLDATPKGAAQTYTEGILGNGRVNSTGTKAYLSVPSYDSLALGSTFTMSGWVNGKTISNYPRIFSRKDGYTSNNGWEIELATSYASWAARGAAQDAASKGTFPTTLQGSWNLVTLVYNDKQLLVYENGSLVGTTTITPATDNGLPLSFGSDSDGSETHIVGSFDEFRLMDGCASAELVYADYSQLKAKTFTAASEIYEVAADAPYFAAEAMVTNSFTTASVSATLLGVGTGATKAKVTFAYGIDPDELGAPTTLSENAKADDVLTAELTGLKNGTTYYYAFTAVNDATPVMSTTFTGSFETTAYGTPEGTSSFKNDPEVPKLTFTLTSVGDGAETVAIALATGDSAETFGAYESMKADAKAGESTTKTITDFTSGVAVFYSWRLVSNVGVTNFVAGAFTPGIDFPRPDVSKAEYSRGSEFTVGDIGTTATLTNFPVLVRLTEGNPVGFHYADFYSTDGSDLVFLDAQGMTLAHEVDTWNPEGESLVWVQIPEFKDGAKFSMWYRSSKPGSVFEPPAMWAEYLGVWHLNEGGDGVQTVADSTTNALAGTTHANSLAQSAGIVGAARRVTTTSGNAATNGRILIDLADAEKKAKVDGVVPNFTFSTWFAFRSTGTGPDYAFLVAVKDNDKDAGWGIQFNSNSSSAPSSMRVHSCGAADSACATYSKAISMRKWYKMDMVWDGTTYRAYYDGVQASTGALWSSKPACASTCKALALGGMAGSGYGAFNGDMDEVRILKRSASAEWVKAEYLTQTGSLVTGGEVVAFTEKPKPVGSMILTDFGAAFAQFGGTLTSLGGEATEAEIQVKVWADEEPADWTTLQTGVVAGTPFSFVKTGLAPMTEYQYKMRAVSNLEGAQASDLVEGAFTTVGTGASGIGGKISVVGDDYVHTYNAYTTEKTFTPPEGVESVHLFLLGGGGAGGYSNGGGGAGGSVKDIAAFDVDPNATYTIAIGAGGIASTSATVLGGAGGATTIGTNDVVLATAQGGNAGALNHNGGANADFKGGSVNTSNNSGGGGAGAGQAGGGASNDSPPSGGAGGNGYLSSITGVATYYGAGGGGGTGTSGSLANPSSAGKGGLGGGGNGGGGNVAVATDAAPTAGTDGLGGGGGGGAVNIPAYLQGANGGSGFAAIRYTMAGTGEGTAVPRVSIDSVIYEGDLKITIGYRVGWAGQGCDTAAVKLLWGYSPTAISREVAVSDGAIGSSTFTFSAPLDQTTYYFKVVATNDSGSDESDTVLSVEVPKYDGEVPGDKQIPAGTVELGHVDAYYAQFTGELTSIGEGASSATATVYIGPSEDTELMTKMSSITVTAEDPFTYTIENLDLDTTYYAYLEVKNDLGAAISTPVTSFTTRSQSKLSNIAYVTDQQNVTISGSLLSVGAGTTDIYVSWNNGTVEKIASFTGESESTEFSASFHTPTWANPTYKVSCSNECWTVAGEPAGQYWTDLRAATVSLTDKASYTWKADADGNWSGNWNDKNHWTPSVADCLGYPTSGNNTAMFTNCTTNESVTVSLPGNVTSGPLSLEGTEAVDLTFIGTGTNSCVFYPSQIYHANIKSGSRIAFKNLTLKRNNADWSIQNDAITDFTLRFENAATVQKNCIANMVLGSARSRLEFVNSTVAFSGKISLGGADACMLVDNSTVSCTSFYAPSDDNKSSGGTKLVLCGAAPKLISSGTFASYSSAVNFSIVFVVPKAGWSESPIQLTGGTAKEHTFAKSPSTGTSKYLIELSADSPAWRLTDACLESVPLVTTKCGFYLDGMRVNEGDPIVTVPTDRRRSCGYEFSTEENPLSLSLKNLQGRRAGTAFIIK